MKNKRKYKKKKTIKKRRINTNKINFRKAILSIFIIISAFWALNILPDNYSLPKTAIETVFLDEFNERFDSIIGSLQDLFAQARLALKTIEGFLTEEQTESVQLEDIPEYSGTPYVILNNNMPLFTEEEITDDSYEVYHELDFLGRCGVTMACIGRDIMPTEERGAIGMIKPSGWKLKKYDIVDGKYLYNRCHLIGYQLTGENANEKNLITGTRYMNVAGMLPFENEVAEYVEDTGNHVMYRVTPVFEGDNLVASGVQMEAWSVEDEGTGVCFHVFIYNVQPGIAIDYATGESWLAE